MENVILIDEAIVRAMVEARDAGLTFEQYAILPDGRSVMLVEG